MKNIKPKLVRLFKKTYKAVFDYKKIDEGFCAYILIALSPTEYSTPERVARALSKHKEVESVGLLAGDWELIVKVRTKDQDEYYDFLRSVISRAFFESTVTKLANLCLSIKL